MAIRRGAVTTCTSRRDGGACPTTTGPPAALLRSVWTRVMSRPTWECPAERAANGDVDLLRALDGHRVGRLVVEQRAVQTGRGGGEHIDALVQIAIRHGAADLVVRGELGDAGGVEEPAQRQHRMPSRPERATAAAGPVTASFGVERARPGTRRWTPRSGAWRCSWQDRARGTSVRVDLQAERLFCRGPAPKLIISAPSACRRQSPRHYRERLTDSTLSHICTSIAPQRFCGYSRTHVHTGCALR